jgi:hypothetical protein
MLTSPTCRLRASARTLRIPAPLRLDDGRMAESPEIQPPRLFHRTATAPTSTVRNALEEEDEKPIRVDQKNRYVVEVGPRVRIRLAPAANRPNLETRRCCHYLRGRLVLTTGRVTVVEQLGYEGLPEISRSAAPSWSFPRLKPSGIFQYRMVSAG